MADATLRLTALDATAAAFGSVSRRLDSLQGHVGNLSSRFRELALSGGLALFAKDVLARGIEAERTLNSLNATLKATAFAAGQTASQVREMTNELARTTAFDDDQILAAATALLRFRTIQGDVFRDAMRLGPDLAAAMGTDLVDAFRVLGRAISDPESGMRGLKAAGVALRDSQIDLAAEMSKVGDTAGAARVVLNALAKSVGGAAAGENQGLYAASRATAKAYDDLLKTIARSPTVQSPAQLMLRSLTGGIRELDAAFQETGILNKLQRAGGAILGFRDIDLGGRRGRTAEGRIGGTETDEERRARLGAEAAREGQLAEARRRTQEEVRKAIDTRNQAELKARRESEELLEREQRQQQQMVREWTQLQEQRARREEEIARQEFEREQNVAQTVYDFKLGLERSLADARARNIERWAEQERAAAEKVERAARELGFTFESAFERAVIEGENLRDVMRGLLQDIARTVLRKTVTEPLSQLVLKGIAGAFAGAGVGGFASGGSFTVGGSGGTDSQLVAFRATPGEQVEVSRSGEGGGGLVINNVIDARGADFGVELRIEAAVRRAVAESVAAMRNLQRRRRG
jgi:hypothetical protein